MKLEIFHSGMDNRNLNTIRDVMKEEFNLKTIDSGKLEPIPEAYRERRGQFDASTLLEFLINKKKKEDLTLWVLNKDIYVEGMNFIFGLAMYYRGAILSIYRLNSEELIKKEAIHEIGHVLGLEHCTKDCVMKFSNSLYEAKLKPSHLCQDCKGKLKLKNAKKLQC